MSRLFDTETELTTSRRQDELHHWRYPGSSFWSLKSHVCSFLIWDSVERKNEEKDVWMEKERQKKLMKEGWKNWSELICEKCKKNEKVKEK